MAHATVYLFTALLAVAACSPEREILASLEPDGGSPKPDAGPPKPEGGKPDVPANCTYHEMCPVGQLCVDNGTKSGVCKPCGEPDKPNGCTDGCPKNWTQVVDKRNGCAICSCAAPSGCFQDSECSDGQRCYAGQICDPGCASVSPKCCHGNFCAESGCTDTSGLECTLVGCPNGQICSSDCAPPKCYCDGKTNSWKCEGGCGATCKYLK